jgi:hypothetical protein
VAATPATTPTPTFKPPKPKVTSPTATVPAASVPAASVPTPSVPTTPTVSAQRSSLPGNNAAGTERLRLEVERRLLDVPPSKAGRLVPWTIINPSSGMLRNNVSVTCRATATSRKLSCSVVAPSGHRVAVLSASLLANGRMLVAR